MRHPALTSWGRRGEHRAGHVNVTPMIDVIMVLIVFYLIVGQLATDRRGDERLPVSTEGVDEEAGETLTLTLVGKSGVLVDGTETELARLGEVLAGRAARGELGRVRLYAGEDRSFGEVRPALEACREAGVGRIELATRRGNGA